MVWESVVSTICVACWMCVCDVEWLLVGRMVRVWAAVARIRCEADVAAALAWLVRFLEGAGVAAAHGLEAVAVLRVVLRFML